ncbi:hypothetical protein D3C73_1101780 [compost metagenome]
MASQRGDSGTKNISTRNARAGTSSAPNIQRQPDWPFQVARMSAWVALLATGSAIIRFTSWAASTPRTMVSWLMATNLPRLSAGLISAMYMGESAEARPIPMPPMMR